MPIATFEDKLLTINAGAFSASITVGEIEWCWNNLHQSPDRRAMGELDSVAHTLNAFAAYVAELDKAGGSIDIAAECERFARKHVDLARAYWHAESRCASSFICGPANFPVRRMQKRQGWADNRAKELRDHLGAAQASAKRHAFPHGAPGEAIRASNPDAADLIREKIAKLEAERTLKKRANGALRRAERMGADEAGMVAAVAEATQWPAQLAAKLVEPNYMGRRGFETWEFSNLGAEIRRLQARLRGMEIRQERGTVERKAETATGEVQIVENPDAARIQLFFPGKPDESTRSILKSNGFRWAPSVGAWQRHLNENGRYAADRVLKSLSQSQAA